MVIKDMKSNFKTKTKNAYEAQNGLNQKVIQDISAQKNEPQWMRDMRLRAYAIFLEKPMPQWGGDLSALDFDALCYYVCPKGGRESAWEDVPKEIKETFEKLGVPEAERKFLAGTGAQFESEVIYHSLMDSLQKKGVIFMATDDALKAHPVLYKKYFGTVVPAYDNKFAALNTAVWSGGTFLYIPAGVHVELPLQAYFRINRQNMGQFERTLIIAEEGSSVHYVEGCTAPTYTTNSLHSAVVEIIVKDGARVQYTTVQNWSKNVYNLVTKRAVAYKNAEMIWLDCNLGSKLTMKYPAIYLRGEGARGEIQSLAFAGAEQHQDAGAKIIHCAPHTRSTIMARSISKDGGRSSYRGLVKVQRGATVSASRVVCNALILDDHSISDTYPLSDVREPTAAIAHEASVARIRDDQLFYLASRGLSEDEAASAIINGFASPIIKKLPMEYAIELNRLLAMEVSGYDNSKK
jgi:Fe-S cluster assembly protein SufB